MLKPSSKKNEPFNWSALFNDCHLLKSMDKGKMFKTVEKHLTWLCMGAFLFQTKKACIELF